ncbi:hypothetical protein BDA96_04G196900 [Sorghum bicolor]|uniref:Uncharacterized protein n=1 Tax=Sorghum bicolor TaxID=4558 RepID=A0A921UJM1_SORBI|nr:hypothetical protein BDA96_04G196900 [Sorghum bicolor]
MAPRVVRALLTATALLAPLLLSSQLLPPLPSAAAAAGSPSPSPAPAPAPHHRPTPRRPPRHVPSSPGNNDETQPPGHQRGGGARRPRPLAPPTSRPSPWWRRLNFGERFGVALAGVAVAMQAALVALLLVLRARQRRPAAAARGKAEEEAAPSAAAAAAAASRPVPA